MFTSTFAAAFDTDAHWESASGLGWALAPGTYWIAFEPESGYQGYMPERVPAPLAEYAFATADPPSWVVASGDFGVRVLAAPEPNAGALASTALATAACVRAMRRRRGPSPEPARAR